MFICNPISPTAPDNCELDSGYWEEVDRYVDELIVQQMFKEERDKYERRINQLQQ